MLKRTLIIAAIAAALPTLAFAQSRIPVDPWVVYGPNPVADIAPSAPATGTKALPSRGSSFSMMPVAVNPDDSGYHAVVTENPYKGKPAQSPAALSSTFRPVVNPEDSGYLGPGR